MTKTKNNHLWQAKDYHAHSSVQNDAATELLQYIELKGHEQILDVGCGDGKITARISKCVPNGCVTGIDISQEMIHFACIAFPKDDHPNLTFLLQDAQQFNYFEEFDVIFSSFALQWIPDFSYFLKCANNSLKSSGYIAATIPLGISSELEKAISIITSLPDWVGYFRSFSPKWHFKNDDKYRQLLIEHQFIPHRFSSIFQKVVFSSRENFEKYIIQWLSYLNPLPDNLKLTFFKEVIDKYLELRPILSNEEVEFIFPRIDFVAHKAIL